MSISVSGLKPSQIQYEGGYLPNYLFAICRAHQFTEPSYREFLESPERFIAQSSEQNQQTYQAICDKWERKEAIRPSSLSDKVWERLPIRQETVLEKAGRAMQSGLDLAKPTVVRTKETAQRVAKNASQALPPAKKLAALAAVALIAGSGIQTYNKRIEEQLQQQARVQATYSKHVDSFCADGLDSHFSTGLCANLEKEYLKNPVRMSRLFVLDDLREANRTLYPMFSYMLNGLRKSVFRCGNRDPKCIDDCFKPPEPEVLLSFWDQVSDAASDAYKSSWDQISEAASDQAIKSYSLPIAALGVVSATVVLGSGLFRAAEKVVKWCENPIVARTLDIAVSSAVLLGAAKKISDHQETIKNAGSTVLGAMSRFMEHPVAAPMQMVAEVAGQALDAFPVSEELQAELVMEPVISDLGGSSNRTTTLLATAIVVGVVYKIGSSLYKGLSSCCNRYLKEP